MSRGRSDWTDMELNQPPKEATMTVYDEIRKERRYQDGRWGHNLDDTLNTPWMWTAYVAQYSSKWMRGAFQIARGDTDAFRAMMVKTAAICVAAVESADRQRTRDGQTFYEQLPHR